MLGTGTVNNPYIIQTPTDLNNIRNKITAGVYYQLGNDIDMREFGDFTPIGGSTSALRFKSHLDGKGYKIKNLTINVTAQYAGFITAIADIGSVKNVFFENANVTSTATHVGVLAGLTVSSNNGNGTVSNCVVTGNTTGTSIVGSIMGSIGGVVENCYSMVNLKATAENGIAYGLGRMDVYSTAFLRNSYFAGTIEATNIYQVTGTVTTVTNKHANNYYLDSIQGVDEWSTPLSSSQFSDSSNFPTFSKSVWGFGTMPYLLQFGEIARPVVVRKVTVTSHSKIEPIVSSYKTIKCVLRTNTSVVSNVAHRVHRQVTKRVNSNVELLASSVRLVNAKVRQYVTHSSVGRIDSTVNVTKRSIRQLESVVESLKMSVRVLTYRLDIPVYANVYTIENQSKIFADENQSKLFTNENQTELKVMK